jgi:hypothetical protein
MKKYFLSFLMLFAVALSSWADGVHFTYDANEYASHTVIWATLANAAGDPISISDADYYVGAFIDGKCRAEAGCYVDNGVKTNRFMLRVGGEDSEKGLKNITFRLFKAIGGAGLGDEYEIPSDVTVIYQGDDVTVGEPSNPFKITFVPATSISLPENITIHRGVAVDMANYITISPEKGLLPILTWDYAASTDYLSMEGNMLTGVQITDSPKKLSLSSNSGTLITNTNVTVDAPATKSVWKDDTYYDGIKVAVGDYETVTNILKTGYTLTPEDATTTFNWTSGNTDIIQQADNGNWLPKAAGTTVMTGVASDDSGITMTLQVTVVQAITGFYVGSNDNGPIAIVVQKGDNVSERLRNLMHVSPSGIVNPQFSFELPASNTSLSMQNGEIVATESYDYNNATAVANNYVTVNALDGFGATANFTVYVIPAQPTSVAAKEATLYLAESNHGNPVDCSEQLYGNLQLAPNTLTLTDFTVSLASSNTDVVAKGTGKNEYGWDKFNVLAAGSTTITATVEAFDNESAYYDEDNKLVLPEKTLQTTFTASVQEALGSFTLENVVVSRNGIYKAVLTPQPAGVSVDADLISISVVPVTEFPAGWSFVDAVKDDTDDTGLTYTLTPKSVGNGTINIYYDGELRGTATIHVNQQWKLGNGWQWVSLYQGNLPSKTSMQNAFGDNMVEARSATQLIINDSQLGYFGDLTSMNTMQTYKLKLKDVGAMGLNCDLAEELEESSYFQNAKGNNALQVASHKGWNWIGNPYQYYQSLEEIFGNTNFSEGDQIKGKTQFAEYTGGHWTGSLTYLTPGEGYLFKKAKSGNINFVREFKLAQATSAPASSRAAANNGTDLWEIDDTPYADNMSMVAQVNSVTDASHCTLWAFVGDECRGKGVAVGDRQFITIHGVAGETVRFYVYDESSRLLHSVYGTQVLEEGRGTYNAPVMLYAGNSVNAIEGIEAPATGTQQMYDLQGRAVKEAGKGLYMVVKQTADGKRVVKKIKK